MVSDLVLGRRTDDDGTAARCCCVAWQGFSGDQVDQHTITLGQRTGGLGA